MNQRLPNLQEKPEEEFSGFGTCSWEINVGSAKLSFLNALKRNSYGFSKWTGSSRYKSWLRARKNREFMGSGTDGLSFDDTTTPRRVTRSTGKFLDLPNVQPKVLEYKRNDKC